MAIAACASLTATASASTGSLTFDGLYTNGELTPFYGAQCANTGTASTTPRLRGNLHVGTSGSFGVPPAAGPYVAQVTLPAATSAQVSSGYTLAACDMMTAKAPLILGQTSYYGLMIYVPRGWSIPNHFPFGDNIVEFQFQNIDAAPIIWQLHGNEPNGSCKAGGCPHVTIALETGSCVPASQPSPGCAYRSNEPGACYAKRPAVCLPTKYAIPPAGVRGSSGFVEGQWNELVMGVDWESSGGSIHTWYKLEGAPTWNTGDSVTGIPTVQWPNTATGPGGSAFEPVEQYTGALSSPLTLYLDNYLKGTSFSAVANSLP